MSSSTWEVLQIPSTKAPSLPNCSIACSLARAACLKRVKVRFHSNPSSKPRVESFPERPAWKIFGRAESLDHPAVSIPKERLSPEMGNRKSLPPPFRVRFKTATKLPSWTSFWWPTSTFWPILFTTSAVRDPIHPSRSTSTT